MKCIVLACLISIFFLSAEARAELSSEKIIDIAKTAVSKNDKWKYGAEYEIKRTVTGWTVIATRIEGYDKDGKPLFVPGGQRFIELNFSGKILSYGRGL